MTALHSWKRRLWGPSYPLENGPPYRNPDGSPLFPGGAQGGPLNGMNDDGPQTGNPVVLTFTGTLTADTQVAIFILDQTAGAPSGGRWVGAEITAASGSTATQVGDLIAADFNARSWAGWTGATNALGAVTFTPQAAGTAQGWVLYKNAVGVAGGAVVDPIDPLPPSGVDGPNSSPHGVDFWISRSGGQGSLWYYWIDVDSAPGPDTKRLMPEFLADDTIDQAYRADVGARARDLGYGE